MRTKMECIRCHGFSSARVCHSCSQRLDAVDYALAELQKAELAMLKKELGEAWAAYHEERGRLDFMERFIVEGSHQDTGKTAWLADAACLRETIDTAMAVALRHAAKEQIGGKQA